MKKEPEMSLDNLFRNTPKVTGKKIRYLGRGAFGEVYQYEIDNNPIAAKFITFKNATNQINENEIIKEIKKEFIINDGLAKNIKGIPEIERQNFYTSKINISKPVEIVENQDDKRYAFISDVAPHGDLINFLFNLVTASSDIADERILNAFILDPAGFLSIIAMRMRECILALHELNYLHLDVAARNFLVYHLEYDENGKLSDIKLKISDLGRAQPISSPYASTVIERGGPLRYMDEKALKEQIATAMSDIYSFKITLISLLGILVSEHPNTILTLENEGFSDKEDKENLVFFKHKRVNFSDNQTMLIFLTNVKRFAEIQKKFHFKMLTQSPDTAEHQIKYRLAEASLAYMERYAPYFVHDVGTEIEHFIKQDNLLWIKLLNQNSSYLYQINFSQETEASKEKKGAEKKQNVTEEEYSDTETMEYEEEEEEYSRSAIKTGIKPEEYEADYEELEPMEIPEEEMLLTQHIEKSNTISSNEEYEADYEELEPMETPQEEKEIPPSQAIEKSNTISSNLDKTFWKKSSSAEQETKPNTTRKNKPPNNGL